VWQHSDIYLLDYSSNQLVYKGLQFHSHSATLWTDESLWQQFTRSQLFLFLFFDDVCCIDCILFYCRVCVCVCCVCEMVVVGSVESPSECVCEW
jgi:hypothetical protein